MTKVRRSSDGLGLRAPRSYAEEASVEVGSTVDLSVLTGRLAVRLDPEPGLAGLKRKSLRRGSVNALFLTLTVLAPTSVSVVQAWPESPTKTWDGNYLGIFQMPPEKRSESFSTLRTSAVPSPDEAQGLAEQHWFENHGLLAEESLAVTGLFRIGRQIEGFASKGDWVWEVRVLHLSLSVDGVLWINSRSKKILVFGPKE